MLTSAASFAEPTSNVGNDQTNDSPVTAEVSSVVDDLDTVTGIAVAQANSSTGAVIDWTALTSSQAFSGDVSGSVITDAQNIYGTATGSATAQGNALTGMVTNGSLDADVTQSAASGTRVDALAALRLGEYAGHAVQTSQAAANAVQLNGQSAGHNLHLSQSSGAIVTARSVIDAPSAEIETATVIASVSGNSVHASGYETDAIIELDQSNTGDVTANADATIYNADYGVTAASQAAGNTATVQTEWGYAHIQGDQFNAGNVSALTSLDIDTFANGSAVGSANAVGNASLVSNFDANNYSGVGQVNTGNVTGEVTFAGVSGRSAVLNSSAIGNAQSAYICSSCPVGLTAPMSQTNSGAVYSGVSNTVGTYTGSVTGSATAVGNASTYATQDPHG